MELSPSFSLKVMDPASARLALAAARFSADELRLPLQGKNLLVALSGGADSTALLLICCALRESLGLKVAAAHLDHALRPESAAEAEHARSLCLRLGVPFQTRRLDVASLAEQWGCGLEEAGRKARYSFLEEARQTSDCEWIVMAHHLGDLAEDVLLRLIRGASWPALGGMRGKSEERHLLRPLLFTPKSDLVAMLKRLGVSWSEDSSNLQGKWRRNRIRNDVLPLFLKENPDFLERVRHLWLSARRDAEYWKKVSSSCLHVFSDTLYLDAADLERLGLAGRFHVVAEAVQKMGGQIRADILEAVERVWLRRNFPRRFHFGGGVGVEISRRGMRFFHRTGR